MVLDHSLYLLLLHITGKLNQLQSKIIFFPEPDCQRMMRDSEARDFFMNFQFLWSKKRKNFMGLYNINGELF